MLDSWCYIVDLYTRYNDGNKELIDFKDFAFMYACNFIKLNDSQNKYIATSKNIYIIPNLRRVLLKLRNEREPVRSGINFTLHLVFKAWWVLSLVKVVSIIGCYCIFNLVRNIDLCVVVNNMTRHSIVNVLRTFDHDHDHQYFFIFF